ncbi:hypothetical protein C8A01DRAFT_31476 [Parachaetomium inaequale]|uniref:Uncharacterized protein n=1 Tax=Parachaetomium inaequale TaxID=2588326 RepID=A0AAN6PNR0_9PEZI|nr:hypothetical protein C8A01DRAFT_31476 [Parachaetomium inaequale]
MGSCSQERRSLAAAAALALAGGWSEEEMDVAKSLLVLSGRPAFLWAEGAHFAESVAAPAASSVAASRAASPVASPAASPAAVAPAADVAPAASSAPAPVPAESAPAESSPSPAIKSEETRGRKKLVTSRPSLGNTSSSTQVSEPAGKSARQKPSVAAAAAAGPSSSGVKKTSGKSSRGGSRPSVASAALAALAVSGPAGPAAPPAAAVFAPAGPSLLAAVLLPPAVAARARANLRAKLVADHCVDGKWPKKKKPRQERHTALGWMELGIAPRAAPCACCQKRQDKLLRCPGTKRVDSDLLLPCTPSPGVARVSCARCKFLQQKCPGPAAVPVPPPPPVPAAPSVSPRLPSVPAPPLAAPTSGLATPPDSEEAQSPESEESGREEDSDMEG